MKYTLPPELLQLVDFTYEKRPTLLWTGRKLSVSACYNTVIKITISTKLHWVVKNTHLAQFICSLCYAVRYAASGMIKQNFPELQSFLVYHQVKNCGYVLQGTKTLTCFDFRPSCLRLYFWAITKITDFVSFYEQLFYFSE